MLAVIKKTVALHPIMDGYVRKLHAILVDKGWNATYSTALNYMVLYQVFDTIYAKKKRDELLRAFLQDTRTVHEIMKEDTIAEYLDQTRRIVEDRYIT
jgi:predicted ABC-class ATPase